MALTVIERPLGNKVLTAYTVNIFNSSSNAAFAQPVSMSNGDYIYISGYVENYNGFWIVDKSGSNVRIKKGDGVLVPFIVTAQVTIYTCFSHYWNCAHLPITYKLKSDTFPVNSVDPIVTITPYGFVGPYFAVQHSSLSGANALLELDFVSLNDGEKIVQVLDHISNTITLLDSDGSGSFINMQKYRSNYNAVVNVYAGLNASHSWASQKPYELAATLKFIPNEDNEIFFSINDILKSFIEQRNNTVQPTLPNSLDDFVQFYISVSESYDESTGYTIGIHESSFTKDTPEPYAVNSILEFKNRYSGFMSDYLIDDSLTAGKFLTLFDTPVFVNGLYFDLSAIIGSITGPKLIKKLLDENDNIIYSFPEESIVDYSEGVYRLPINTIDCSPVTNETLTEILSNTDFNSSLSPWVSEGAHSAEWIFDASNAALLKTSTQISIDEFTATMDGWTTIGTPYFAQSSDGGGSLKATVGGGVSILAEVEKNSITPPGQPFLIRILWEASLTPTSPSLNLLLTIDDSVSIVQTKLASYLGGIQETVMYVTSSTVYNSVNHFQITVSRTGSNPVTVVHIYSVEVASSVFANTSDKISQSFTLKPSGAYRLKLRISQNIGFTNPVNIKAYADNSGVPELLTTLSFDPPTSSTEYQQDVNILGAFNKLYYIIESIDTSKPVDPLYIESANLLSVYTYQSNISKMSVQILNSSNNQLSELKYIDVNCGCSNQYIYLTWRNNLGGMDYWNFTAFSEYGTDIGETGETKTNILPSWPSSYGETSSEIRKQTFRDSSKRIVVSSQNLTLDQKLAIEYIRSSILVEIMYSRNDKRRVIVDKDSFISYKDNDKLYTVSFSISYTDNIPSQRL